MTEKTHWLQSPNKNYIGHWDLPENGDLVLTIESAQWEGVTDPISKKVESCRVVKFKEKYKPLICNQTNAQSILKSTGVRFMEDSIGCKIRLFEDTVRNHKTKEDVSCIRIRRDAVKAKQVLNEKHSKWAGACKSVKEGAIDLDGLRKHFEVTDEAFKKMQE